MNLVTDGAPALALAVEPSESTVMERPPRTPSKPIIDHRMMVSAAINTAALLGAVMLAYTATLRMELGSWTADFFPSDPGSTSPADL